MADPRRAQFGIKAPKSQYVYPSMPQYSAAPLQQRNAILQQQSAEMVQELAKQARRMQEMQEQAKYLEPPVVQRRTDALPPVSGDENSDDETFSGSEPEVLAPKKKAPAKKPKQPQPAAKKFVKVKKEPGTAKKRKKEPEPEPEPEEAPEVSGDDASSSSDSSDSTVSDMDVDDEPPKKSSSDKKKIKQLTSTLHEYKKKIKKLIKKHKKQKLMQELPATQFVVPFETVKQKEIGNRDEVIAGLAKKTRGGLGKADFVKNKHGKWVSKRKHENGKLRFNGVNDPKALRASRQLMVLWRKLYNQKLPKKGSQLWITEADPLYKALMSLETDELKEIDTAAWLKTHAELHAKAVADDLAKASSPAATVTKYTAVNPF
jgi:hypothetical protein